MLDGALKLRAREYVATLYPGAVVDVNDMVYLDGTEWGRFLNEALAQRGLMIEGGEVVMGPYQPQRETA